MRLFLTALTGLALTAAFAACGDDEGSSSNCGPGTVEQNGQCVPITDTFAGDTNAPVDTAQPPTDTGTPTDTGVAQDTAQPPQDTVDPGACDPGEVGSVPLGGACTKDCQCDQSEGNSDGFQAPNFCYSGAYMNGFSFCSRSTEGTLFLGADYVSVNLVPGCFAQDIGNEGNSKVYMPTCQQLSDCKMLATQYTHCGTGDFAYTPAGSNATICVQQQPASACTNSTMTTQPTCVIETLPPFAEAIAKPSCQ